MQIDDDVFFLSSEVPPLNIWAQVVHPPQSAALSASQQPGPFGEGPPVAVAVEVDEVDEDEVFVGGPRALLQAHFLTARSPPHFFFFFFFGFCFECC